MLNLSKWGFKKDKKIIDTLTINYRPNTTDMKAIDEVLIRNCYQKKSKGIFIEPNQIWLDLGANIGSFSMLVLSSGAKVIAVEPEPDNFNLLSTNLQQFDKASYFLENIALSDTDGTCKLYLTEKINDKYRHSTTISRNRTSIDVPSLCLDSILAKYPEIDCIKMDIEGYEIPMLENIDLNKLNKIRLLVFEYTFDYDRSVSRFKSILNRLNQIYSIQTDKKIPDCVEQYHFFPRCINVYCLNRVILKID